MISSCWMIASRSALGLLEQLLQIWFRCPFPEKASLGLMAPQIRQEWPELFFIGKPYGRGKK